jgi:hypothetical protein
MILAAAACAESDLLLPDGTPSTLAVRVYVDRDGNGTYDAGSDVPIAGGEVTVAQGDAVAGTQTSDADGLAAFSDLVPGAYRLALIATRTAGTVLATATNPQVVAPYSGDALTAEFRFAFEPGTVAGALYRDDDGDGAYTPGVDTPLPGANLALIEAAPSPTAPPELGSSFAPGDTAGQTTTDGDGAFLFEGVRPGNYTIDIEPIEDLTFPAGTSIPVTAGAEGAVVIDVEFEGDLLITVAEARAAPEGRPVTIEAIVTWQEQWRRNLAAFVQDGTAGINLFDFDCDFDDAAANCPEVVPGDSIRVTGVRGAFSGELQLGSIIELVILGSPGTPTPRAVTAAQINAGEFQGELVTIDGTVTDVLVLSFDNQVVTLDDAAGEAYTVYVDSRTGVGSTTWAVGSEYVLTGVLGNNANNTPSARLEVRSPSDVLSGSGATPIGTARGLDGDTVIVEGIITWQEQWSSGRVYFLQDETGGISTFHFGAPAFQRGDVVRVQGEVSAFGGEIQLSPILTTAVVGQAVVPAPRAVTGAEINAGEYQGQLATVQGTIDSVVVVNEFGTHIVWLTDNATTIFTAYVDNRTGFASTDWTLNSTVTLQGVLGTNDGNTPAPRIEPRDTFDVVSGTAPTSIADARAATAGTTVTVEGVVTWQQQWDSRVYFLQDGTAGISTFHSGGPDLNRGDRIRITGDVGAFAGETQLSPITALAVLGQEAIPSPRAVTGAEINAGEYQGELATVGGTVDSVVVINGFDTHIVWLTDDASTVFTAYVDNRTDIASADWTPATLVTLTGVLGTNDSGSPAARIEPRDPNDIQ